jgi:hypothetical protein
MASIWLTITENNLSEGGRPRDPREVYLNLTKQQAVFLPAHHFPVLGDDKRWMVWLASGHAGKDAAAQHAKNLRAVSATTMGDWLLPKGVKAGDGIQVTDRGDGSFFARHLPADQEAA